MITQLAPPRAVPTVVRRRVDLVPLVIWVVTALGLALRVFQLCRPGYLFGVTEYDDGVYFGDAIQLVHGVFPYRDFVSVHPPGIMLLMAPVAALSSSIGAADGLAIARMLTVAAGTVSIVLAGRLVRHRGPFAVLVATGFLACYPDAVQSAHTLLLEPWLSLCCLIGLTIAMRAGELVCGRRLLGAGVAFGFAGAVKVWAIVPVLVLALLCLPEPRRAGTFLGGVAAGFLVPVLPFAVLAPGAFAHGVIFAQLGRVDSTRVPVFARLASMSGAGSFATAGVVIALLAIALILGAAIGRSLLARYSSSALARFAVASTALLTAMFLWPPDFYYHYAAFLAPFLAIALGLAAARLVRTVTAQRIGLALGSVAVLIATVLLGIGLADLAPVPLPAASVIAPGACVLSDTASLTIAANRFNAHCGVPVDAIGTDYALSGGRNGVTGAGAVPAVAAVWANAFRQADYVWLSPLQARRIAWTPALLAYFQSHFQAVPTVAGLYQRIPGVQG